jgi:hypothetical protein
MEIGEWNHGENVNEVVHRRKEICRTGLPFSARTAPRGR